ncbi:MAG: hypothetical protein AB1778_03650 [Candidatus Bipolaricaulota bacterium]
MSAQTVQGANTTLDQLAARQSRLESRLMALEQTKLQARRDLMRAERDQSSLTENHVRPTSTPVARRLEAARQALENAERERHEIVAELPGIRRERQDIVRRAASPAWARLQRLRAEEYAQGLALAADIEARVTPYSRIVAESAEAKSELDALLATLGQEAQDIRKALASEVAETPLPDTPGERRALRCVYEIRRILSQELSHRW